MSGAALGSVGGLQELQGLLFEEGGDVAGLYHEETRYVC